ncbi:MAG TPA: carboxymuconolactone decarboxylase family protein [Gaiellaceae bacterium]|nr:carboxymuconolactone decarboxylase family protein [Gaiellaceae bacterium]
MTDEVFDRGLEIRRRMFGASATDAQLRDADDFTHDLQELVTRYCFGEVWGRKQLSLGLRSMLTVAMLVALGRDNELRVHVRGALANGVSREDLREIFLHAAVYCGIPAAVGAFRTAREVFAEADRGDAIADPTRA